MQAIVLSKVGGGSENVERDSINLQSPSVVQLKIAPEAVRAFERIGNDLKLVLLSGEVVVIQNFFVQDDEGNRSDLVLEDDAGVQWWGQYKSPWSQFDFAEIEDDVAAAFPWWPGLLGLLGIGAAAAAAGGGGGGSSGPAPDRAPELVGTIDPQQGLDAQGDVNLDLTEYFSDPEGGPLRYTATGLPKGLTLDPETGIISGTIDPSASQDGDGGTHTVTITVTDPAGNSTSQTFPWTVGNPPPVANDDTVTVEEDTVLTGNVLTGTTNGHQPDSDPDGDPLTITSFEVEGKTYQPGDTATITGGSITLHPDGSYTFTPEPDWNGSVPPIKYTISDGEGGTDTATLTITVTPVPDAQDDTVTTPEDTPITIPVLENDDFDGDNPTITHVGGEPIVPGGPAVPVENGTVTLTPDGKQLIFTPDPDWNGETPFDYTVVTEKGTPETVTVTVKVTSVDDIEDDTAVTSKNTPTTIPVLDNDNFREEGNPQITHIDGQPIEPGVPVTVEHGTVTLNPDGTLTFDPTEDWSGNTSFTYTVTSGGVPETATVDVTVIGVGIVDNARPGDPNTGDDVLATIDDLENTSITGQIPVGGTITELTVTDGTNTVTIPVGDITVNEEDGTFTTTGDLSGLTDGPLTVTLKVKDSKGNDLETDDEILKDTVVNVDIDPVLVVDGEIPTITGTSDFEGVTLELRIGGGDPILVEVGEDGTWSYTSEAPLDTEEVTISVKATDEWGNEKTFERKVASLTVKDDEPDDEAHIKVYEAGLTDGSDSSADTEVESVFTVGTTEDDITHIVIGGSVADGALTGGTLITLAELETSDTTPINVPTEYGVLTIKGYNPATGEVEYTYTLDDPTGDHDESEPNDSVREDIQLAVVDNNGDTRVTKLVVAVVDDAPEATPDTNIVEAETYGPVTGNVISGVSSGGPSSDPDVPGADDATLTHIRFGDTEIEVPQDGTDITIPGEYGVLTIDNDGNYSYRRNEGSGGGNSDVFTYVLTDGDGDTAETTLTIEIEDADVDIEGLIGATGTGDVTVNESKLTDGTGEGDGAVSAGNIFTVNSPDGIGNLSITHGSETIVLVTDNVVHDFAVDGPLTLTTDLGTLTVTGFIPGTGVVNYSYELTDDKVHTSGGDRNDGFESFTVNLSDMDGDTTSGTLGVRIVDDMPVITPTGAELGKLEVSEASLGEPSDSVDFSAAFDYEPGADGEKERVYSFVVNGGVATGLIDVASGESIVLVDTNGDGSLITGTVGEGGAPAFTITIDDQTGEVVLTQILALQHAESGEENTVLTLAEGALSLKLSVTDNDDDETSHIVDDVGGYFSFEDDTPTIETDDSVLGSIQLDETGLVTAVGGLITTTVENFATGVFTPDYGADDEAETDALVYSLDVTNGSSGLTDSVSDEAILLRLNGTTGEVEAYTETSDDLAFTVSVDPETGALTLTQYRAIEHGTPGTEPEGHHNESISMASDLIRLVATATDGDGDSTPASVSISDKISFLDDGPAVAGAAESGEVNEKHLPLGSAEVKDPANLTATGSLRVTPSADGVTTQFAADIVAKLEAQGHQSGGAPLTYELSLDGHTLTATSAGGETVFVVTITNPTSADAGYEFVLSRALNHDSDEEEFDITFDIVVTDGDGDTDTAQFSVTVLDDAPVETQEFTIPEDGSQKFNTTADSTPDNTFISQNEVPLIGVDNSDGGKDYLTEHGKVTVNADGTITYTPAENYSGTEVFKYTTSDGDTTVTINVTPVSDAPTLDVEENIGTQEDTAVSLGLKLPVITDDATGDGNNDTPERLGAIELTLSGEGAGTPTSPTGVKFVTTIEGVSTELLPVDGKITVVIVDASGSGTPSARHVTDVDLIPAEGDGVYYLTQAEFEAIQVHPAEHRHENFTVTYSATSYEVDGDGAKLPAVDGAPSSMDINVHVQAVTDDVALDFNSTPATEVEGVDAVIYATVDDNPVATVTMKEDTTFILNEILHAEFDDLDGSELRSITIKNTTGQTISVNGEELEAGNEVTISAKTGMDGQTGDIASFPDITIGGVDDFSGVLDGIEITINARDQDDDGHWDGSDEVGSGPGVPETNTGNNTVILNLRVTPVAAGDVEVTGVETEEDTEVAFLAGVKVTDTGSGTGEQVIDSVSFTVPAGWSSVVPPSGGDLSVDGWSVTGDGSAGTTYTITFNNGPGGTVLSQGDREDVLAGFKITPPAHSSLDADLVLTITTTDSNSEIGGGEGSDTHTDTYTLKITVTPVAEEVGGDSDGNTTDDLTMTPGRDYTTPGDEDEWFTLGVEGGFNLGAGWVNEDGNEKIYARLTPKVTAGTGDELDATGSKFRWSEDGGTTWKEEVYAGTAIDVPVEFLHTLEFMGPLNFSGMFEIEVKAVTKDYDDDHPNDENYAVEAVSGNASLTNILIRPVADELTLAVTGNASGKEDTDISLWINPTSLDPSETFTVEISGIPVGAVITYGGLGDVPVQTSSGISFTIENFDPNQPLHIRPPEHSNVDFDLNVTAVSVDKLEIEGVYSGEVESSPKSLPIHVTVQGVADPVTVGPKGPTTTWTEEGLDSGTQKILLSDLVELVKQDTDDSEILTVRVSGLPDGFSPSAGTRLTGPDVTGEARIWLLTKDQFDSASINVPKNFSGTQSFQIEPVTTENDGDSYTTPATTVGFTVIPSVDATVVKSATVEEDVLTSLGFDIVHRNEDLDEQLGDVRILASDLASANFTLYLGNSESEKVTDLVVDGEGYYVLTAEQARSLHVKGGDHLDGELGGFNLQYKIIDDHFGDKASAVSAPDVWLPEFFELTATPVTDKPDVSIADIDGNSATTDLTLSTAGSVTVNVNVNSPDSDGSEHIVRVVVTGVPDGVFVQGAEFLADGTWLFVYDGTEALPIGPDDNPVLPIVFDVSSQAGGLTDHEITIEVQVQDRGNDPEQTTLVENGSVSWTLTTEFEGEGGEPPATITGWSAQDVVGVEEATFRLSDLINGTVEAQSTQPNTLTITIDDESLPAGTEISGMKQTTIGGKVVWTASVTSAAGEDSTAVQAKLSALMDSIEFTLPKDLNKNHDPANFTFDVKLTTSVLGGKPSEPATASPDFEIEPRTDVATFEIGTDTEVNESSDDIPFTVKVGNDADGAFGVIVDGKLYLQVSYQDAGGDPLEGGTLTLNGGTEPLALENVTGVLGLAAGDYYVIDDVTMGETLSFAYTPAPDTMTHGELKVDAWVQNFEEGDASGNPNVLSSGSGTIEVELSNDGVTIVSAPASGPEVPRISGDEQKDALIKLNLSVALKDDDDSEQIYSILLTGVPEGFLVFTGTDVDDATESSITNNAGGSDGTNTWVISDPDDGSLPKYIAILPPAYWSGTLDNLHLVVESGEKTGLPETRVDDPVLLEPVVITPVANGITLTPTTAFGRENGVIPLNLNAAMPDMAQVGDDDGSIETATLQLTGLGEHASFYLGNELIHGSLGDVKVEASGTGPDTVYTISGLSHAQLHQLGFKQAKAALEDQDTSEGGVQITVKAWTVESADESINTEGDAEEVKITLTLFDQLSSGGDDTFIWTGTLINGRGGNDTVQLRYGEELDGADLATHLRNIEVIDLSIAGSNAINNLEAAQVRTIVGVNNGTLTIKGGTESGEDSLSLSGDWVEGAAVDGVRIFTSELAEGNTMTLRVEGEVDVTGDYTTEGSLDSSSFSPFSTGFADSFAVFGLAHLETDEADADDDFLFGHDEQPELQAILSSDTETGEDIGQWLPESEGQAWQQGSEQAPAQEAYSPEAYVAYAPEVTPLDDELRQSQQDAHVVG